MSDPSVSRLHAQLTFNNGLWTIHKVSQQNKLFVNQNEVEQAVITNRDTIGLGAGTNILFQTNRGTQKVPPVSPTQPQNVQAPIVLSPQQVAANTVPPYAATIKAPGQPKVDDNVGLGTLPADIPAPGREAVKGDLHGIPTLEVSTNTDREKHTYPLNKQVINIGREPSNDIVINRPTVSGLHAQIVREGNQLVFIHPHPARGKTLNGIVYQGRTIQGDEQFRKTLTRGDVFRISDEHGTLVTLTYNDGSGVAQDIIPELRPIPLGVPVITLGRLPDNTVVLDHPQVSSHHARLEQTRGGYRIIDLGSTNHVYVNAQRVTNQALRVGDEIRIGPFKFMYSATQLTQQDESTSIRIDALHLKKVGHKHAVLINDISLAIPPRKFVAIVGSSGTGKSMLMDALNGLRPAQQGVVFYNGQDYYRHLAAFSTQLGYVPQDDIIHKDLTVEHALYYAARLRLPDDYTRKQIKERIKEVLEDVEMRSRRNLLVSKLSGGERKRVSIALELLANPSVFFLDEPTSGLDPGLDRKMMLLLRKLADKGHTIVLVTHATNNINVCDYVCFLCRGGRLAYFGPPSEAIAYFGKADFAEIYSALEPSEGNKDIPSQAEADFKKSQDYQTYVVAPLQQGPAGQAQAVMPTVSIKQPKRGNPWRQFTILSRRYLELLRNDMGNLAILFLQAPVIGLLLLLMLLSNNGSGTFFRNSITTCSGSATVQGQVVTFSNCQTLQDGLNTPQGQQFAAQQGKTAQQVLQDAILSGSGANAQEILLIMAFAAVMFGCINGAREVVKEVSIYKRERAVNLGIAPYMFSKIVVLGVLCLVQSAVLVLLVNSVAPFDHSTFLPVLVEIYITMA
ncbi:MAG: FHA domain-containing protein, partial [Ktedonobacteraceae bacterium]|nr:FHA domain-containing protein [Ktedonobacteraceae bacterium]